MRFAFRGPHGGNWHPLTSLSHMLDCELFGLHAGRHLAVNVALHAANAVLLFLALLLLTRGFWPSLAVAALFALHPLRAESVAWVSERKDVLSGLFWMLTLLAHARYARGPTPGRYLLVATALGLGLMAKPMLVTLPFVLLLLDRWPLARPWSTRLLLEKVPLLALSAASCALTLSAQTRTRTLELLADVDLPVRLANASVSYLGYLAKTLWPADLAFRYLHPSLAPGFDPGALYAAGLGAALALLGVSGLVLAQGRRRPYLAVGWLWYLGTLVPVIGLVQVGSQSMADRYTYLPTIGIGILLAWSAGELAADRPRLRAALRISAPAVVLALMGATFLQVGTWRDSRTLYEHAIRVSPEDYAARNNLGALLLRTGELEAAERLVREALEIEPGLARSHVNLGDIASRRGDRAEAVAHYEEALRLDPDLAQAHNNLGVLLSETGSAAEALRHLERAVALDPTLASARYNLGALYLKRFRIPGAVHHLEAAVRLRPGWEAARETLERARARLPQ